MKRKVLSIVICLAMLMSTFAMMPMAVGAEEATDATETVQSEPQAAETTETQPAEEETEGTTVTEPTEADVVDETESTETDTAGNSEEITETEEPSVPAVNFTNVAPFLPAVEGTAPVKKTPAMSLFASAFQTLSAEAQAEGEPEPDNGLEIDKTATANDDGTYTVKLEAYATGQKIITEVTEDVPTDIVLVLDQSGSMANSIGSVSFDEYGNSWNESKTNDAHYDRRHNGGGANLYYPLSDGKYAPVSVKVEAGNPSYTEITNGRNNNNGNFNNPATNYWNNRTNLYAEIDGEYQKVTVSRTSNYGTYTYTYTLPNGTVIATSQGNSGNPDFGTYGPLYLQSVDASQNVYTYTYTDTEGVTQTIGTSTGANNNFGTTLYERVVNTNAGGSRLSALTAALNNFTNAVNEKAAGNDGQLGTADDVNHRIAMVGFASGRNWDGTNYHYGNTELFVGDTQYTYNGGRANDPNNAASAQSHYNEAFQSMNTEIGRQNINNSIDALDADGGTIVDLGVEMASGILTNNPIPEGEERNQVVIVFTDGQPGWSGYDSTIAGNAISEAESIKDTGATVYSVGIFAGADATSAGNANGTDTQQSNWFMQNVSSNNGTPQNPSYYLSAADADSLNDIFEQISDNIEQGGSSSTLTEEAVVKDIISDQFELPAGADASNITLETYKYIGENQWEKNSDAMGATAAVNGSDVSVTGFDFSENWCGTETAADGTETYRGNKLVISFKVKAKDGFLGGNNVKTNAGAGVYENATSETPVEEFEKPEVNVPIKDITVTAQDKNVYLLGGLTADQIKNGAVVKAGDIELVLAEENYGLNDWQNSDVDIQIAIKDANGNTVTDGFSNLTDDQKYSIEVTVSPKTDGAGADGTAAVEKKNSGEKNINVFKPELIFKDSEVYYGDTAPINPDDYNDNNKTPEQWKHGGTLDSEVTMIGDKPELAIAYTPEADSIKDGVIAVNKDIAVDATVKIGNTDVSNYCTFKHENCSANEVLPVNGKFWLHVKDCTLTIDKTIEGGIDENQSFIFTVKADGSNKVKIADLEVTVLEDGSATITGLPVGKYNVTEDTLWSWRYIPNPTAQDSTLSSTDANKTLVFENTRDKNNWLNGNAYCENAFEALGN